MKFWILTLAFVTFAEANLFPVMKDNITCLLLQLNGSLTIPPPGTSAEKPVTLSFENATVLNDESNCTVIKLNLTKSVEVWFQFNDVSKEWSVTPISQFIPHNVFNSSNYTAPVVFKAAPLDDSFNKTESYQCNTTNTILFNDTEGYNKSLTATVSNFRIQSVNESHFVPGKECKKDVPSTTVEPTTTTARNTTAIPTTASPTTPKHTTPEPGRGQNFSCSNDTTTKFRVIGTFSLDVKYNETVAGKIRSKTVSIEVPKVTASATDCSSESSETLTFKFYGNWSIEYVFQAKSAQKYYVSNITITYVHDERLPNSTQQNSSATVQFSQADYLEASSSGYYTCQAKTSLPIKEVTLYTEGFKYKAFNKEGDITFSGGDVTECQKDEQTSSVVPIAVGAALAGLVVIVLIAYLIGRRRSRKAGYESV